MMPNTADHFKYYLLLDRTFTTLQKSSRDPPVGPNPQFGKRWPRDILQFLYLRAWDRSQCNIDSRT